MSELSESAAPETAGEAAEGRGGERTDQDPATGERRARDRHGR
jgi:hypothetical protein